MVDGGVVRPDQRQVAPPEAPVHLLVVEEVVLRHQPRPVQERARGEHVAAGHVFELARPGPRHLAPRGAEVEGQEPPRGEVHAPAVALDHQGRVGVEGAPPDHREAAPGLGAARGAHQGRGGARLAHRVGVQDPEELHLRHGAEGLEAAVHARREAAVGARLQEAHHPFGGRAEMLVTPVRPEVARVDPHRAARPGGEGQVAPRVPGHGARGPALQTPERAVGRGVVHHEHAQRGRALAARGGQEALQAVEQRLARAIGDDHHADAPAAGGPAGPAVAGRLVHATPAPIMAGRPRARAAGCRPGARFATPDGEDMARGPGGLRLQNRAP